MEQSTERKNLTGLLDTVQNGNIASSLRAMKELRAVGDEAVGPLVASLREGTGAERWRAAMALARLGQRAVDPLITVAAAGGDEGVANPAVWALAEIGDRKAVPHLIDLLRREQSVCCRVLTAAALLRIGDPAGVDEVNRQYAEHGEEYQGMVMEAFEGT
ncbi:MAG: HEAT repeat domain-containing protein [Methanofollis sp.]|uniref:HEAT repeat domain-containing protein n=1 Tax=Methanofollis sp. TaxID=2052835 RepID=UPI00262B206B|nr:HEAT repeat domain-containing protein [Methanofollis sp.]MDD4254892.1 HEAT repeat domain-containing protein [Methanofollis sp.]